MYWVKPRRGHGATTWMPASTSKNGKEAECKNVQFDLAKSSTGLDTVFRLTSIKYIRNGKKISLIISQDEGKLL